MPAKSLIAVDKFDNSYDVICFHLKYAKQFLKRFPSICASEQMSDRAYFNVVTDDVGKKKLLLEDHVVSSISVSVITSDPSDMITTVNGIPVDSGRDSAMSTPVTVEIDDTMINIRMAVVSATLYDMLTGTEYRGGAFPAIIQWLIGIGVLPEEIILKNHNGW